MQLWQRTTLCYIKSNNIGLNSSCKPVSIICDSAQSFARSNQTTLGSRSVHSPSQADVTTHNYSTSNLQEPTRIHCCLCLQPGYTAAKYPWQENLKMYQILISLKLTFSSSQRNPNLIERMLLKGFLTIPEYFKSQLKVLHSSKRFFSTPKGCKRIA
jgi:hypothetical protein